MKKVQVRNLNTPSTTTDMQRRDSTMKTIFLSVATLLTVLGLVGAGFLVYQVRESQQESNIPNYLVGVGEKAAVEVSNDHL